MTEGNLTAADRSKSGTPGKAAGISKSSTARVSMGYLAGGSVAAGNQGLALGKSPSQPNLIMCSQNTHRSDQKIELSSHTPMIAENIAEEDGENSVKSSNQKYFNLVTNFDQ